MAISKEAKTILEAKFKKGEITTDEFIAAVSGQVAWEVEPDSYEVEVKGVKTGAVIPMVTIKAAGCRAKSLSANLAVKLENPEYVKTLVDAAKISIAALASN